MAFAALPTTLVPEDTTAVKSALTAEAVTAGFVIRKNAAGTLAIADSEVAAEDDVEGIALVSALAAGQPLTYAPIGSVVTVSGLTPGQTYYLGGSADQGEVGLFADATTGTHFATVVGVALSATRLQIVGIKTDVQL